MKRVAAVVFSAAMLLSVTACGGQEGCSAEGIRTFPCYNSEGIYTDPETGDVWQLGGYN